MDKHIEKLCIWSGPVAILLFFTGLFSAGKYGASTVFPGRTNQ